MQFTRAHHAVKLATQADELFVNGAAVSLDLRLAGPADKTQSPPLTFKVRPGAHQAGALICQSGHFDLQDPFAGPGAVGKDFKDQPGAI